MIDETQPLGVTNHEDISGLKQPQLTTRGARNAAELENITRAYLKYVFKPTRKKIQGDWITDKFIRDVHLNMFGDIWDWAGKYRTDSRNIGIDYHLIPEQIGVLCGDFKYWNSPHSSMPVLEVAARLQNRLTRIHPFANGNGRHARLITDIYLKSKNHRLPKWPQIQLMEQGNRIRNQYIEAMKKADQENYAPLIQFIDNFVGNEKEGTT
ncbi:hypothetical protein BVX98_05830 [bacterium F11]|nr:hypothetical protein BVX98_05830 [bacterium F11]